MTTYPAALRRVLCELYSELPRITVVLNDLGIDRSRVALGPSVDLAWHSALEEVAKHDKLASLCRLALAEYPTTLHVPYLRDVMAERVGRPRAWVQVAGYGKQSGMPEWMQWLARAVGIGLALRGMGLITGGWHGVDYIAADGFCTTTQLLGQDALERHQIITNCARPRTHGRGTLLMFADEEMEYRERAKLGEAVILIGGFDGTERIGRDAWGLRCAVLPLVKEGHEDAAARVWSMALEDFDAGGFRAISREEFSHLSQSVESASTATGLVRGALDMLCREVDARTGFG